MSAFFITAFLSDMLPPEVMSEMGTMECLAKIPSNAVRSYANLCILITPASVPDRQIITTEPHQTWLRFGEYILELHQLQKCSDVGKTIWKDNGWMHKNYAMSTIAESQHLGERIGIVLPKWITTPNMDNRIGWREKIMLLNQVQLISAWKLVSWH